MPTITLLEKVYGPFKPQTFQTKLTSLCKGLLVKAEIIGKTNRGWLRVRLIGEDQKAAIEFLKREIGLAPENIAKVKKFSTFKGKVISIDEREEKLIVDIGVESPHTCDAAIPLERLQAQLANGKKLSLRQLTQLFCLYNHMPLHLKIIEDAKPAHKQVTAELSEAQISKFNQWMYSNLERLIILGVTEAQLKHAIKISGHKRDIIKTETLGLLEHTVLCKLGTNAVGLTPKLGPFLHAATLIPFNPKKIQQTIYKHAP
jgi:hypothetical protein